MTMTKVCAGRGFLHKRACRALCTSNDGWIFGHILDGAGGSKPLAPWDSASVKYSRDLRDGVGAWVHLDVGEGSPQAQSFIANCTREQGRDHEMKRQTHVSSLMVADPRKTQPRCEVALKGTGLFLTLQVNFGKRFEVGTRPKNIVPFRMWLGRGILVTARGPVPDVGELRLPALSRMLQIGRGPATCGALASAVISEITSITANSVLELEDEVFALKARMQQEALRAGAHRPVGTAALQSLRRELMPLRYAAISMRRYEVPDLAALETVVRLTERPEQTLFSDADKHEIREAKAQQEALVESLYATIAATEALQNEVAAHVAWQQGLYSYQLTMLGCVLSVLGLCSVSIDVLALLPHRFLPLGEVGPR